MKIITSTAAALAATAMLALGTLPAFAIGLGVSATAQTGVNVGGTSAGISASTKLSMAANTRITARANQEITRRINALNTLSARINAMQKLSADEKSSLAASIQAQISTLTDLQAKITADASSTVDLKADAQSITSSYRIFALIIPQGAIEAAADRVLTIVDAMNTLGAKLQARIASSSTAGFNSAAAAAAYTDLMAKVGDAQTQANAAVSEVSTLKPDMGDKTQLQANQAALKDARSKIQAAQKDLVAARKDAGTIVKALMAIKVSAKATTTAE